MDTNRVNTLDVITASLDAGQFVRFAVRPLASPCTTGSDFCRARKANLGCTRDVGHNGWHEAGDMNDRVIAVWS